MPTKLVQVDVFTTERFKGNVAAVCFVDRALEVSWMQALAGETCLPVTSFVEAVPRDGALRLRWFTPTVELPLCGHGTVAAAHATWEVGLAPRGKALAFSTASGIIAARENGRLIELDLAANMPEPCTAPAGLGGMLGAEPVWVGTAVEKYFVELANEREVRALQPDLAAIARLPVVGLVVTARGSGGYDFVSRYFAPRVGVPEDPVTGSAHTLLTPFWAERLGRTEMTAYQASPRGGVVHVRLEGRRAVIGGSAVTVVRGELAEDP